MLFDSISLYSTSESELQRIRYLIYIHTLLALTSYAHVSSLYLSFQFPFLLFLKLSLLFIMFHLFCMYFLLSLYKSFYLSLDLHICAKVQLTISSALLLLDVIIIPIIKVEHAAPMDMIFNLQKYALLGIRQTYKK